MQGPHSSLHSFNSLPKSFLERVDILQILKQTNFFTVTDETSWSGSLVRYKEKIKEITTLQIPSAICWHY